jgi:hypothetical protein|tara:strand:- start:138 stop:317 length:180 start_codon:yes stop_codon:yes gene_type:complete
MEFMETTLSLNEKELNAILDAMMLLDQTEEWKIQTQRDIDISVLTDKLGDVLNELEVSA